jgi:hypothetical protein
MIPKITGRTGETEEFARYEFKYLLSARQRAVIEEEISHFMIFDGHVHEELENSYLVRSLYFDDVAATNYYEKIDGVRARQKFRIRTYGQEHKVDLPIYLELKGRHIERTFKHRIAITPAHLPILTDPERHHEFLDGFPGHWLAEKFVFESYRKRLRPKVLVDYVRRPYTSEFDMNFRVTFDDRLTSTAVGELFVGRDQSWRRNLPGYTILEVKFHRRIPAWFHRILQANNLRRVSISKFCKGMEVCDLAVNLS